MCHDHESAVRALKQFEEKYGDLDPEAEATFLELFTGKVMPGLVADLERIRDEHNAQIYALLRGEGTEDG